MLAWVALHTFTLILGFVVALAGGVVVLGVYDDYRARRATERALQQRITALAKEIEEHLL